jgi:hypothetical protein
MYQLKRQKGKGRGRVREREKKKTFYFSAVILITGLQVPSWIPRVPTTYIRAVSYVLS